MGYAVVTGGGSGIGRAFCQQLASRGWKVAVADRCGESAAQVAEQITECGWHASAEHLDVAEPNSWQELHARLSSTWPRIDLLVNNAGVLATGTLDECSPSSLERIVDVNLLGTMYGCHTMLPWLRASSSPAELRGVVNMASIFAAVSPPGFAAYNATKAGVLALTETLRGELRPHGLSATAVLPGATPTRLFETAEYGNNNHVELCQNFLASSKITADQVAREALDGALRGHLYVVVGTRSKWYARIKRLAPQWLIDNVGRRAVEEYEVLGNDRPDVAAPPTRPHVVK